MCLNSADSKTRSAHFDENGIRLSCMTDVQVEATSCSAIGEVFGEVRYRVGSWIDRNSVNDSSTANRLSAILDALKAVPNPSENARALKLELHGSISRSHCPG